MSAGNEREVDDRIADWVDGRLSDKDRDRFVAELRVSPQLRQDLEEYERTVDTVRRALQAPTVRVQLADRVLAAIESGRQPTVLGRSRLRLRPLMWSLATAAGLLVTAWLVDGWSAPGTLPGRTQTAAREDADQFAGDAGLEKNNKDGVGLWDRGAVADGVPPAGGTGETEDEVRARTRDLTAADLLSKNARASSRQRDQGGSADQAQPKGLAGESKAVEPTGAAGRERNGPATPGASIPDPKPGRGAKRAEGEGPVSGGVPSEAEAAGRELGEGDAESRDRRRDSLTTPAPAADEIETTTAESRAGDEGAPAPDAERVTDGAQPFRLGLFSPPAVSTPAEPIDPLPLVVVLGRAPAAVELFAARARKDKAVGGGASADARAAEEAGRRFDAFFTAQVAEMSQPPGEVSSRSSGNTRKTAPTEGPVPPAAVATWLQVAEVRLLQLPAVPTKAGGVVDRNDTTPWVERDWLVEGSTQDVAALLGRLATFARESDLQLRTGETTDGSAFELPRAQAEAEALHREPAKDAPADAATGRRRLVLRFRLQGR